jgi:TolA-binding protein
MSEFVINQRLYDDNSKEIGIVNEIGVGKYDVVVVAGSTLPTNRYAELEMYMDAYKNGVIDRREVLKKTEVFDMEGVLQRTDLVGKLQQQLEGATKKIKELEGDIQTREREVYHARQRAELEKFKAQLDSTSAKARAAGTVFEKRLNDATGQIQKEVREMSPEELKQLTDDSPQGPMGNQE